MQPLPGWACCLLWRDMTKGEKHDAGLTFPRATDPLQASACYRAVPTLALPRRFPPTVDATLLLVTVLAPAAGESRVADNPEC